MKYDVNVTRDGRWWMIEVPAIDGLTQARRVSEVEDQARSLIAVTEDVAPSSIELGRVDIVLDAVGHVGDVVEEIEAMRQQAADLEAHAATMTRTTIRTLVKAEVPMRDIGTLFGVSHQRVAQLANEATR